MMDFSNCLRNNLWQERKVAAACEDSGCLGGEMCLLGVSVIPDAQFENSR